MKARPILFSSPMIQALLDSRKTQTRRGVKPQPEVKYHSDGEFGQVTGWLWADRYTYGNGRPGCVWRPLRLLPCPYGKPGDLLWVRETFARNGLKDGEQVFYRADGESQFMGDMRESNGNITRYYTDHWERNGEKRTGADWKPSIHMPRWASRLTLEITGVRVERLQDISEADAVAEGLKAITKDGTLVKHGLPDRDGYPGTDNLGWPWSEWEVSPSAAYKRIWESINGPNSWEVNPWVWVLEFKVHRCNVDDLLKARAA